MACMLNREIFSFANVVDELFYGLIAQHRGTALRARIIVWRGDWGIIANLYKTVCIQRFGTGKPIYSIKQRAAVQAFFFNAGD